MECIILLGKVQEETNYDGCVIGRDTPEPTVLSYTRGQGNVSWQYLINRTVPGNLGWSLLL